MGGGIERIVRSIGTVFGVVDPPAQPKPAAPKTAVSKPAKAVGPTAAEVEQATSVYQSNLDTTRRGRAATIMTSPSGVMGEVDSARKTLLGG